jgi:hypothetical protein
MIECEMTHERRAAVAHGIRRIAARSILALLAVAAAAGPGWAQIFRWIDERGVAHYSEGLDSIPERHRAGAVPLGLRNAPAPATTGTAGAATAPAGETVIRYTPGEPIMVDVRINGSATARLLLDTGADRTLISPRALAAAGVRLTRPVGQGQMFGVTGSDRMDFVVVDSIAIGDARATRLAVAAYEMPMTRGDGLLGRDFLDRFKVNIDSARGIVTLSAR